ncbi:polysaccharide deacetylase [Syntrophobotulus glycolicus DSM 8271]|uniref:Polysaccharide deacetylase n=1 Tax=Syntrophobotulus glycolicus (strain DSM 8271 / FlGlyR) TaxID=645991 RepID=F0SWJ8_SYNGF|nr:polysaccharide deacetylase [Syntrophobotulus glycolicus]ADY56838.1 polysaccharide deacetylase [Syntrophobotulus glycolicus DSM 8271]
MDDLTYQWPDGKKIAVSISFDFDGESPYLWKTHKTRPSTLGELEQRRFGPRQGIYRILEMLSRWEQPATFFVPGFIADKYPQAVEKIAEQGHEIALHGYLHERVDELNEEEIEETVIRAKASLGKFTGPKDLGYRSPSWEMTEAAFKVLQRHHVLYDSSLMGYDHPYWVDGLPEIPVQWLLDDAIFYRYTASGSSSCPPQNPANVIDLWKQEFNGMKRFGGLFLITMHPWMSGRASRLDALEQLISHLKRDPAVWWGTCADIAAYHSVKYADRFREKIVFDFG